MRRKIIIAGSLAILGLTLVISGCQSKAVASGGTSAASVKAKKIVVGTGSTYKNVCFLDDKNQLTGYEVEALKKVDELLPQYEFEFKILDFSAILPALETGKIDLAAHQFESNNERRSKYDFATEGVTKYDQRLVVKDTRNDIKSLDDLANISGTIQVGSATSNTTYLIEQWNRDHGNKLKTVLSPGDTTLTLQTLESGKIDAFLTIERTFDEYKKTYNAKIKIVGDPVNYSNSYYLYRKNDADSAKLKKDVDEAVVKLKEDGTLKKLSEQWLGGDYIPEKGK
jgi:ABC-type amino acid transport/signal transduction systems, periplasmic component/domain